MFVFLQTAWMLCVLGGGRKALFNDTIWTRAVVCTRQLFAPRHQQSGWGFYDMQENGTFSAQGVEINLHICIAAKQQESSFWVGDLVPNTPRSLYPAEPNTPRSLYPPEPNTPRSLNPAGPNSRRSLNPADCAEPNTPRSSNPAEPNTPRN